MELLADYAKEIADPKVTLPFVVQVSAYMDAQLLVIY